MKRKESIGNLVYNSLFPNPRPEDPANFHAHLTKNLVGEVRIETTTFYGSLETIEARYPGLNYSHAPHRKRLGRFPHHARLFKAFDDLRLTELEIAGFCRWEGTLWARERYERDEGVVVKDTTGMEIGPWVDKRKFKLSKQQSQIRVKTDIQVDIEEVPTAADEQMDETMEDEESDEEELQSIGNALTQRLIQNARLRQMGVNVTMDPEYEQYLKDEQERGVIGNHSSALANMMAARGPQVNTPAPGTANATNSMEMQTTGQ